MTKTLYSNRFLWQYISISPDLRTFEQWCRRWKIDRSEIPVVTPYIFPEAVRQHIFSLQDFDLIIFGGWTRPQLNDMDEYLVTFSTEKAAYIHDTELESPHVVAGYIVNWKNAPVSAEKRAFLRREGMESLEGRI